MNGVSQLHSKVIQLRIFKVFTWIVRVLLALGFLPSGLKKILGERFTTLDLDTPVGFFFEALYRTGFYWNFLGFMQLLVLVLILIPRTAFLGAILYLPIILNIFIIVVSMNFKGTPYVVGLMVLANLYLLFWDFDKLKKMLKTILEK
tara:strand:- start:468324 stop:468764 length:441 start_codon:yes stop_codon:yes gene_type:complete